MNLQSLSRLPDDLGGPLGPPLPREQPPAPAPVVTQRADGVLTTHADGTMTFEPNEGPHKPTPGWPFPTGPTTAP